ncbi:recombinase family protein [Streptomyces sp. NPDC004610]|uniref:recombinase family protein n=1 Tax=unclassified Streptomyces TaxID=2593676 RepID=UPI0033BAA342
MVSEQSEEGGPAAGRSRRTDGQVRRRRALADAAAGVEPGEAGLRRDATRVGRFRCVIYLCGASRTDIAAPREECTEYAEAFGWVITEVIEERAGLLPPHGRDGLRQAVEQIRQGSAGAVLTAWRAMISPVAQEYDEVAREIESAGGFLHVKDAVR